jgi:hypothetical protein
MSSKSSCNPQGQPPEAPLVRLALVISGEILADAKSGSLLIEDYISEIFSNLES